MNWGTGIFIVFSLFVAFILALVVKTYSHKVDLVSEDYYSQELRFQERIDKMNNVKLPSDKVTWELKGDVVIFQFPSYMDSTITGTIEFFRPSDSGKDIVIPIVINSQKSQSVQKKMLVHGLYKVKVDWKFNNKGYFMEEDLVIQ